MIIANYVFFNLKSIYLTTWLVSEFRREFYLNFNMRKLIAAC